MDVRPVVECLHHVHDDRPAGERRHLLVGSTVARIVTRHQQHLHEAVVALGQHPGELAAGVIVHHVASVYPLEVELAQTLAAGNAIAGVGWDAVHQMNAQHAQQHAAVGKTEALDLLQRNSRNAAAAVRALTDEALDRAAPVSLNADAPLTCQFFIEDHALRHSFHHLARIRATVAR